MTVDERLEDVFRSVFDDEQLTLSDDMTAADVPGWDSLAHINLMFSIESEFGITFQGDELADFADIGALKRFLESAAPAR